MKTNKIYKPILILTALPFESKIIFNYHININIKPKKLTTYQVEKSIYLIEVPIGFKFDPSVLNGEIKKTSPKLIINFGICGALDSTIPIGSSFCIERVCHFNKEFSEIELSTIVDVFQLASLLTVDQPVLNEERRDKLYSQTGCQLVEMEAFHIARFCERQNFPLLIVKVSSDLADEDSLKVIKANRSKLKHFLTNAYEALIGTLSQY